MDATENDVFDAFDALGLDRRLAVTADTVENAWHALSREAHPDAETGDAATAATLNRAKATLAGAGSRLRHWLELSGVEPPRHGAVDGDLMELFARVGGILAEADAVLKQRAEATTALSKALLAEPAFAAQKATQDLLGRLQRERLAIEARFSEFDADAAAGSFENALAAAGRLGFLEKWEAQCRGRIVSLISG
ncbi:MAG: hypothetical protein KDM91_13475 [Verrucomicrobiae bacterium]|nr:hypothetical protein [Verrucomicrobiae bacterium]